MSTIFTTLAQLTPGERDRVLRWVLERFDAVPAGSFPDRRATTFRDDRPSRPSTIHELLERAQPASKTECALVVADWIQAARDGGEWSGNDLNQALRNVGSGLSNVTRTLTALNARRPPLVMQVSKAGRSRQARKTYKVTAAGHRHVQNLLDERVVGT